MSDIYTDAERFRWLEQYLQIAGDGPNEWTCWLALEQIPFRFDPRNGNAIELLDALMERWPLTMAQSNCGTAHEEGPPT